MLYSTQHDAEAVTPHRTPRTGSLGSRDDFVCADFIFFRTLLCAKRMLRSSACLEDTLVAQALHNSNGDLSNLKPASISSALSLLDLNAFPSLTTVYAHLCAWWCFVMTFSFLAHSLFLQHSQFIWTYWTGASIQPSATDSTVSWVQSHIHLVLWLLIRLLVWFLLRWCCSELTNNNLTGPISSLAGMPNLLIL
jgi:hypothetical protein